MAADTDHGRGVLTHDGSESGVTTEFALRDDGAGFIYLINGEVDGDDAGEALSARLVDEATRGE